MATGLRREECRGPACACSLFKRLWNGVSRLPSLLNHRGIIAASVMLQKVCRRFEERHGMMRKSFFGVLPPSFDTDELYCRFVVLFQALSVARLSRRRQPRFASTGLARATAEKGTIVKGTSRVIPTYY